MTVFLLIAQYVKFEESYENFILESDNLYRVTLTSYINNELVMASAENYPGLGPALANELPEVEGYGINSLLVSLVIRPLRQLKPILLTHCVMNKV